MSTPPPENSPSERPPSETDPPEVSPLEQPARSAEDGFDWERYGLSNNPPSRFGQLSCCNTAEAIIWADKGEDALKRFLLEHRS